MPPVSMAEPVAWNRCGGDGAHLELRDPKSSADQGNPADKELGGAFGSEEPPSDPVTSRPLLGTARRAQMPQSKGRFGPIEPQRKEVRH